MTSFRFIHASDLHLGRRFANIPQQSDDNIRGRLMEARHDAIRRIADAARAHHAGHVLLAGDTFHTATPSVTVWRQALSAMALDPALTWWILPGNHDNLRDAEPLWDNLLRDGPDNVRPVTQAAPLDLDDTATLLPAPVTFANPGRDLTDELVTMPSSDGAIRVGLAHGGVVDFTESGAHVPPDRDRLAKLDYLALGDWHGRLAVGDRTHYPGSPEQDRFKHDRRGACLAVTIAGPGAVPQVTEVTTGTFLWHTVELNVLPGQDVVAALERLLPGEGRRDVLLRINALGWAGLPEQADLTRAAQRVGPEFAHFELVTDRLGTQYSEADLDAFDAGGALRMAANTLMDETRSAEVSAEQRDIAGAALSRLYAITKGDGQ